MSVEVALGEINVDWLAAAGKRSLISHITATMRMTLSNDNIRQVALIF